MRIRNRECLIAHGNKEGRRQAAAIIEAGLTAADPYCNTKQLVWVERGYLYVGNRDFEPDGSPRTGTDCYELGKDVERVFVFGAGKGIQRIAMGLEENLGEYLTGGFVISKKGDEPLLKKIQTAYGGHPVPDEACVVACKAMVEMIHNLKLTERDLVFTIVGNGVSSLMSLPPEGISLEEVGEITRLLQIEKGLVTTKVNMVRNQVDLLKGGRITRLLSPAKMIHLVAIDGNAKNSFGDSGYRGLTVTNSWLHTLPDISRVETSVRILKEADAWERIPASIRSYLEEKAADNPGLGVDEFEQMDCRVYGLMPEKLNFLPTAMEKAGELGFTPHLLSRKTFTEANASGRLCAQICKTIEQESVPFSAPCALFLTGELLVTVAKADGIGGRNQEFALAAAQVIRGSQQIVIAAVDTDGTDGPGGHFDKGAWEQGCQVLAGGLVDGFTAEEAEAKGISLDAALKNHDTSGPLWRLDSGIWATQNISVCDLILLLIQEPK